MRNQTLVAAGYALLAFGSWGFIPMYFKAVADVSALEVLAHRIIWAVPLLIVLLMITGHAKGCLNHLKNRRTLLLLLFSATILSVNWLIFIWAVTNDRVLETSLGYFINPLMNIMLGVLVLKERLGRVKSVAVVLAVFGVASLAFQGDAFPWVSLSLALTFSVYGLIRKTMPVRSREGLLLETSFMLPIALFYAGYLVWTGQGAFLEVSARIDWLLVAAGAVTALPLIWFATAARRLNYSTVGFFQYIAPSIQFLLAVFLYNEPFSQAHMITFACVWGALLIFTGDSLYLMRRRAR